MKKNNFMKVIAGVSTLALLLTGCQGDNTGNETNEEISSNDEQVVEEIHTEEEQVETEESEGKETVIVEDVNGQVEVPVNPERIVALDNRTFETLEDWNIEVQAVPKGVMPANSAYVQSPEVLDIGNHREPDLEIIAAVDPQLVIIGQRFASHEADIRELVPNAAIINLNFDVSENVDNQAENFKNGFINSTKALGDIFQKEDDAKALIGEFESSIASVQEAYNVEDTIMSIVVSAGEIGFSAPGAGRVWGPMYELFNWTPALQIDESSSDHKGDDISVEAIAQSNPDWILVLDRDAAVSSQDSVPAKDVIEGSQALKNTTAIQEGNVVYAPADTYTNESIQTYIELFNDLADNFAKN